VLGQPQGDGAAERVPRHDDRLACRPVLHERRGEGVELRQDRPGGQLGRAAEAGQVHGQSAALVAAELGEQGPPGVGRVAPPVEQQDARAVALELEGARAVPGDVQPMLEQGLHR
jgi:hypothetical protein